MGGLGENGHYMSCSATCKTYLRNSFRPFLQKRFFLSMSVWFYFGHLMIQSIIIIRKEGAGVEIHNKCIQMFNIKPFETKSSSIYASLLTALVAQATMTYLNLEMFIYYWLNYWHNL